MAYLIPKYNGIHFNNNCHINSCFTLLSCCNDLINNLKNNEYLYNFLLSFHTNNNVNLQTIYEYLSNNNIEMIEENCVIDTMKNILKIIYNHVNKNLIYLLDMTDFELNENERKLKYIQKIDTFHSKYLLIDMDTLYVHINKQQEITRFIRTNKFVYKFIGAIYYIPNHFITVIAYKDFYILYNDLMPKTQLTTIKSLTELSNFHVVLTLYQFDYIYTK